MILFTNNLNLSMGGQPLYSCRIPHFVMQDNKAFYTTIILSHQDQTANVVKWRYSEFKEFNSKVEKSVQQFRLPVNLPQFPGKKIFGKTNKSLKSVQSRKKELKDYMTMLLQIDKLYALPVVKAILPQQTQGLTQSKLDENILRNSSQQYTFAIDSYQQLDDIITIAQVHGNLKPGIYSKVIFYKNRFSDLREMHQALKDRNYNIQLPEFPKRQIWGITNESPTKIEDRKIKLQDYLNQVFGTKALTDSDVLSYFIENSKLESQKLQKFDAQKMMARLKLKAQQMGQQNKPNGQGSVKQQQQQNQGTVNEIKPTSQSKKKNCPNQLKKGLFIIREQKEANEDEPLQRAKQTYYNVPYLLQYQNMNTLIVQENLEKLLEQPNVENQSEQSDIEKKSDQSNMEEKSDLSAENNRIFDENAIPETPSELA